MIWPAKLKYLYRILSSILVITFLWEQLCWAGDISAQHLPANLNNPSGSMNSNDLQKSQSQAQGLVDAKNDLAVIAFTASTPTDVVNSYYTSGKLESVTLATPDALGNIYYHYINEDWNSQGYGRVDKSKRSTSLNNELSFTYTYYTDSTGRLQTKKSYSDANYTTLVATYTYANDASNGIQSVAYSSFAVTYYSQGYTDVIGDFGSNGMYKYTNNKWNLISQLDVESYSLSPLNNNTYDIIGDFGSSGMWKYTNNKWNLLSYLNADSFTLSPLNNGTYDIIADFGPSGMWKYTNSQWNQISLLNADSFTLSPLNNGTYDIIADFGSNGMWKYSNNQWNQISFLNADSFTLSPLNNGTYDIIADFGSNGMWKYSNNQWNQISFLNADSFALSPLNNNTYDIIADFGPGGMWKHSNNKWNQISFLNADSFTLTPLNNNTYEIIGDFGSNGMYRYTNNKWNLLSYLNADSFTLSPLNNNTYDIIADFGSSGMWKYTNNKWNLLSYLNADSFTLTPLNNNTYDIIGDFASNGMWKYTNNKWNQISFLNADSFTLTPLSNGTYEIIGDFGSSGMYKYTNNKWNLLSYLNADSCTISDTTYRVSSKTLTTPDSIGNIYYHYIDENWNNQGYGRVDQSRLSTAINNELSHTYSYYADSTGRLQTKNSYSDVNFTTLVATYTYTNDVNNRLSSKTLATPDALGMSYYHYLNENWNNQGYGRVDQSKRSTALDGELSFTCAYYLDSTGRLQGKKSYSDANFTTLVATYTYTNDASNLIYVKPAVQKEQQAGVVTANIVKSAQTPEQQAPFLSSVITNYNFQNPYILSAPDVNAINYAYARGGNSVVLSGVTINFTKQDGKRLTADELSMVINSLKTMPGTQGAVYWKTWESVQVVNGQYYWTNAPSGQRQMNAVDIQLYLKWKSAVKK